MISKTDGGINKIALRNGLLRQEGYSPLNEDEKVLARDWLSQSRTPADVVKEIKRRRGTKPLPVAPPKGGGQI